MKLLPDQLAALAAVVRRGSFDLAAADLSVTPSAISQRIKAFEEQIGTALVVRGQPCTATKIGERLARHGEDMRLLEARLLDELALGRPSAQQPVRIAVNADSLATWFVEALAEAPGHLFDLVIDDQDHTAEQLRNGRVCAAVTAIGRSIPGCDSLPLGALRYHATTSPGFRDRWFAEGLTRDALASAPCLVYNAKDKLQDSWMRQITGHIPRPPVHLLPSTHAFVAAASAGLGWGMNPVALARPALEQGHLVTLAEDAPLDVPMYWQISRLLAPALTGLTDAVRKAAKRNLIRP
jgi:LysR family transcriptional regulator (chromosome initiation inhibitor)